MPGLFGEAIEKNDVQNDPADGQQAVGCAIDGCCTGLVGGHSKSNDGDDESGQKTEYCCSMGLHMEKADAAQQDDNWQSGEQC